MSAVNADRNLLFGLLALQIGLIDQDQLVAAFRAWSRDKGRQLAEYLVDRGDLRRRPARCGPGDGRAPREEAWRQHREEPGRHSRRPIDPREPRRTRRQRNRGNARPRRLRSGFEPDRCRPRPHRALLGRLGHQRRSAVPHPAAPCAGRPGAVFVALDTELHREVALKQILDHYADDPTSRQRFLLEAEVTGGLEHPGIVPVYGLGTYGDGRPYYAMRFIRGDSLKEAIDQFHADAALKKDPGRRSLELRKLLRRFTDVCNAIEYAHSRGVLHRDIKPGNIIVGKHGETLVVDWGLAKPVGRVEPRSESGERTLVPSSASGSAETLPGSALGTPAYMSPEQAEGDLERLGPRSDVYSLGATLYCLLTGKPPFEGDVADVIRGVQKGGFRPPRQVDPSIDRALEAVCLKAMALKPDDRYATPKALAEDIERWMADEPVTAWREPWSRRARRWAPAQPNGGDGRGRGGAGGPGRDGGRAGGPDPGQCEPEGGQRRPGRRQRQGDPRQHRAGGLQPAGAGTVRAGPGGDPDVPHGSQRGPAAQTEGVRWRCARSCCAGHRSSTASWRGCWGAGGPRLAAGAGTRLLRGGRAHEATRLDEGCVGDAPACPGPVRRPGERGPGRRGAAGRGRTELRRHRTACSRRSGKRPRPWLPPGGPAQSPRTWPRPTPPISSAGASWRGSNIFMECFSWTTLESARGWMRWSRRGRSRRTWSGPAPRTSSFRLELAQTCDDLAMQLDAAGRTDEALAVYGRARELVRGLFRAKPADPRIAHELVRTLGNMAIALESAGRPNEALAAYDRAREVLGADGGRQPDPPGRHPRSRLDRRADRGILIRTARDAEALPMLEAARKARETLVKADTSVIRDQTQLIGIHYRIAEIHARAGRVSEARASYESAVAVASKRPTLTPATLSIQSQLAERLQGRRRILLARRASLRKRCRGRTRRWRSIARWSRPIRSQQHR